MLIGNLEPDRKLKLDELQSRYGFSSTPLREALNRLAQEGLVRADERRGFRVAPISIEDLEDITRLRLLLDVQALADAIEHGDDGWEAGIVAAFYRLEKVEGRLGDERYRRYSARHRKTSRRKASEHRKLMEAVLKRDGETACALLAEHIDSTRRNVDAALLRAGKSAN